MRIKICEKNSQKIEGLLLLVNGKSSAHTYTDYSEISKLAEAAEAKLSSLEIPKKYRSNAKLFGRSGDSLPNAYRYMTTKGYVTLTRGGRDWFLVAYAAKDTWDKSGAENRLQLTSEQSKEAISHWQRREGISLDYGTRYAQPKKALPTAEDCSGKGYQVLNHNNTLLGEFTTLEAARKEAEDYTYVTENAAWVKPINP